jgi:hypothetical protein
MKRMTNGITRRAAPAITSDAVRQPTDSASAATIGRNTSCPVAPPAVRMPITRPRRSTNQRFAIVAANTIAIEPVPSPISTPHVMSSWNDSVMNTVSPLPSATISSANVVTVRMPNLSMRAAANGAVSPYRSRLMLTAKDMTLVDHPNSSCSGTINAPGAARKPAAPMRATKAVAATSHAGWMRERVMTSFRENWLC